MDGAVPHSVDHDLPAVRCAFRRRLERLGGRRGTRENFKHEARYILRLFIDFLHRLRELDRYDSSIILLEGDHGTGFALVLDGITRAKRSGRVTALMLLKTRGASGPLRISTAQTTVADVQGGVYDSTSWHEAGGQVVQRSSGRYKWGQKIGFGTAGNGGGYLASGWSTGSANVNWSEGPAAHIIFDVDPPTGDVRVHMVYWPNIVPGRVDRQRIQLTVQGIRSGSWRRSHPTRRRRSRLSYRGDGFRITS